jgi:hypothetical protein
MNPYLIPVSISAYSTYAYTSEVDDLIQYQQNQQNQQTTTESDRDPEQNQIFGKKNI